MHTMTRDQLEAMTREELRDHMKAARLINTIGNEEVIEWQVAFKKFRAAGGGSVDMECGSCWLEVKDWLEK